MRRIIWRAVALVAVGLGILLGIAVGLLGSMLLSQGRAAPINHPLDDFAQLFVQLVGILLIVVGVAWILFLGFLSLRLHRGVLGQKVKDTQSGLGVVER